MRPLRAREEAALCRKVRAREREEHYARTGSRCKASLWPSSKCTTLNAPRAHAWKSQSEPSKLLEGLAEQFSAIFNYDDRVFLTPHPSFNPSSRTSDGRFEFEDSRSEVTPSLLAFASPKPA